MFENLTERLNNVFTQLRRRGKLSAADVDTAMREVRLALLEADVNYGVVKDFVARVRERSIGAEVSRALNPGQQVVKIVNEELIATLGEPDRLNLSGPKPRILMLVGLQGSGKTTAAGTLARSWRSHADRALLAVARPCRLSRRGRGGWWPGMRRPPHRTGKRRNLHQRLAWRIVPAQEALAAAAAGTLQPGQGPGGKL